MSKPILFDFYDRQIIREYYKNPSYWSKSLIVSRYEWIKAKKEFGEYILNKIKINLWNHKN